MVLENSENTFVNLLKSECIFTIHRASSLDLVDEQVKEM